MNLNQVTVPTINLEKSIDFYEKLGLRIIVKSAPRYARFECPNGDATFSIHLTEKLPSGEGIVVYFECENLDKKVAELQEIGLEFTELPNDKTWLWREAHLSDPDGNRLILFWAGDHRKSPPWRI
jgi:catechol 2,3-dioxygenase-like lactoylglutathione lyase family enzyme